VEEFELDRKISDQLEVFGAARPAEYDSATLRLLTSNLLNPDVFNMFIHIMRFRKQGGLKKAYLPDWNTKRRRYDNAILILEATKFITKKEEGTGTPYFPTSLGEQLAVFLIQEVGLSKTYFNPISEEQLQEFLKERTTKEEHTE